VWNENECTNLVKKNSIRVTPQSCSTLHSGHTALLCCACEREAVGEGGLRSGGGRDIMRARQTLDSNAVFSSTLEVTQGQIVSQSPTDATSSR